MSKILIVAATKYEIGPFLNRFKIEPSFDVGFFVSGVNPSLAVLITGVGMVNTAYYMGRYFLSAFNYTINAGICGAFNKNIRIGEVVNVTEDIISEMGAQDGNDFIKYGDMNLGGTNVYSSRSFEDIEDFEKLKKVKGITVNSVHGNDESITKAVKLFGAGVESMEGAAFLRGCEHLPGNCFQIRSVSNYVEKRDKSKWDIPLAVNNLNELLIKVVEDLQK
jgi:futalosine hydrolase